jgi:hypothetical protein
MSKMIKMLGSDLDKLECYKLTAEILSKKLAVINTNTEIAVLSSKLRAKCAEMEKKAGEPWKITPEFDLEKEGAEF